MCSLKFTDVREIVVKGLMLMCMFLATLIPVYGYEKGGQRKGKIKTPLTAEITKEIIYRSNYYGLDPLLIMEVIRQESSFNPNACSKANARGLMQFIPSTARRFGITNPHNISQSIDAGCRYLSFLIRKFDGRLDLVLAGYNAGEGAVEKYNNTIPPYEETRNYVRTIISSYKRALAVKQAFVTQNNVAVNYKSVSVVSKKPLTKREIQKKLNELDAVGKK